MNVDAQKHNPILLPGLYPLKSASDTLQFGEQVGKSLAQPVVLALFGDLGAGKTTFVQGLARGLGIKDPIQSPTFVLLNLYEGLAHFDLYRLKSGDDFEALGFDEYLGTHICAIEWPEKIEHTFPKNALRIHFKHMDGTRLAEVIAC